MPIKPTSYVKNGPLNTLRVLRDATWKTMCYAYWTFLTPAWEVPRTSLTCQSGIPGMLLGYLCAVMVISARDTHNLFPSHPYFWPLVSTPVHSCYSQGKVLFPCPASSMPASPSLTQQDVLELVVSVKEVHRQPPPAFRPSTTKP